MMILILNFPSSCLYLPRSGTVSQSPPRLDHEVLGILAEALCMLGNCPASRATLPAENCNLEREDPYISHCALNIDSHHSEHALKTPCSSSCLLAKLKPHSLKETISCPICLHLTRTNPPQRGDWRCVHGLLRRS